MGMRMVVTWNFSQDALRFTSRPIFVVGMLQQVVGTQPLCLINERSLLRLSQHLPLGAQPLGYLRVVHLGIVLRHLAALST